jgi:hypothetical protein
VTPDDVTAGSGSADGFCVRCGEPRSTGAHTACDDALTLEPPRYCAQCRRRMVVQVTPRGFTATCSVHGVAPSPSQ